MKLTRILCALMALVLCVGSVAFAQGADPSPAIYVAQKTVQSVVGVQSSTETWTPEAGQTTTIMSQGSGVVVKDGGYILTNYHVIENCNFFEVLLPSGEYIEAKLVGSDSSLDIAVLQAESDELVTCEIGSVSELLVGSTVIAIGNPGGDTLANTVTQGIVSALERDIAADNAKRAVNYIQHDAAISSGNSGGGLFDYRGRLVGINTLKYSGSAYSQSTFEGLGFALPVDTVIPLVEQIIEFGKVIRPQIGVYTLDWEGPEEAIASWPPMSVLVAEVMEDGPSAKAGVENYDFITHVDGERVNNYRDLTSALDKYKEGDVVELTVLRYGNIEEFLSYYYNSTGSSSSLMGGMFGYYAAPNLTGYEEIKVQVTLEVIE